MMKLRQANLIGKHATVTASTNKMLEGIQGTVSDETKNTLVIGNKKVIKTHVTIKVEGKTINGKIIQKQQTERIKVQNK